MRRAFVVLFAMLVLGVTVLTTRPSQAVVGGTPASGYSFMASVQSGGGHFCGGTVIANEWVLTAAHCVPDGDPSGLTVRVGSDNNLSGGSVIAVDEVVVHPDFDGTYHDAALLHLVSSVPATVQKITLATTANDNLEDDGTPVIVAGWGDTNPLTLGLGSLPIMTEATLNVVDDTNCYGDTTSLAAVTTVCAEALLKDSCQGDSGGPLFWKSGSQRIQIGIVSHGLLCAIPLFPGAYSEVNNASIRSFITTNAGV